MGKRTKSALRQVSAYPERPQDSSVLLAFLKQALGESTDAYLASLARMSVDTREVARTADEMRRELVEQRKVWAAQALYFERQQAQFSSPVLPLSAKGGVQGLATATKIPAPVVVIATDKASRKAWPSASTKQKQAQATATKTPTPVVVETEESAKHKARQAAGAKISAANNAIDSAREQLLAYMRAIDK